MRTSFLVAKLPEAPNSTMTVLSLSPWLKDANLPISFHAVTRTTCTQEFDTLIVHKSSKLQYERTFNAYFRSSSSGAPCSPVMLHTVALVLLFFVHVGGYVKLSTYLKQVSVALQCVWSACYVTSSSSQSLALVMYLRVALN